MTNNVELGIIAYILNYNNYTKYIKYINISKELNIIYILYNTVLIIQEKYPNVNKSVDDLEVAVFANYPNMASSERKLVSDMCQQMKGLEISDTIIKDALDVLAKRNKARDLALMALEVSEGIRESRDLEVVAEEFIGDGETDYRSILDKGWVTSNLFELREKTFLGGGLYWPLRSLNMSLGPLRKGDKGFVFARPETGKTTFLSHATTHMALQVKDGDGPIIWFNNEEQGDKVRTRTFQAAFGVTRDELYSDTNIQRFHDEYLAKIDPHLRIFDNASIHRRDVEAIAREYKPSLLVMDTIDKIRGFDADRPDIVYGRIYQWARELAKTYAPVIGTCQADGTGEGVKWLTMSHVAEAKTAKQAEADWILGIGRSHESGMDLVRFFNISKNKLMGDADTDPELRHGRFDVFLRSQIARYEDIIE